MRKMICVFWVTLNVMNVLAQSEKDVKETEVPSSIKNYLQKNYTGIGKIKYYKETIKDSSYYEASFTYKNDKYDLLFKMDGSLHEVERVMKFEELSSIIRNKIIDDLSKRYLKFKIMEVEEVNPRKDSKYEINIKGKKEKHTGYYELFYSKDGAFLMEEEKTLKSIPNNSGF